MKRTLSLLLGFAALALIPAIAQNTTGKIHGHIIDPGGLPKTNGTVSLSEDGGKSNKYIFPVSATGEYSGEAKPGTYMVIYRQPETAPDKIVDGIGNVKIAAGTDIQQDLDMTRKEFMDRLTPDQRKQMEEYKQKNAEIMKANAGVSTLNADLEIVRQDMKDKKFEDAESLMLKDTAAKPDSALLWLELGLAQSSLKKYDDAAKAFKKALELDATSNKPNAEVGGLANSGLGEIYARSGKVPEANASFEAAVKADPSRAATFLSNQAIIFYQVHNADAQVAAADLAIQVSPNSAMLYYLKANGLVQNATLDTKTQKISLPPGCAEAFEKYLALAPDGQFAADSKSILESAGRKINSGPKAAKK